MPNKRTKYIKLGITVAIILLVGVFVLNKFSKGEGTVPDLAQYQALNDIDQQWSTEKSNSTPDVPGMTFVGENEFLSLFINKETTEVAVVDRKSGKVWYTNPPDRNEDTIATPFEKNTLGSQFYFVFADSNRTTRTFYNNQHSILLEQFEIEEIPNGIRVVYTVGDMSRGIESFPRLISEARYNELFVDNDIISGPDKAYASRRYRLVEGKGVYERLDSGISSKLEIERMLRIFDELGYTAEDLNQDNIENDLPPAELDKPIFIIPLEYRVDGDTLLVTIPGYEIDESKNMRIREIALLPYFGAANQDQNGYIFVPDGSGTLIYLNNGKSSSERYAQRVYGRDQSKEVEARLQVSESARLPVFGMKHGDHAMFAIIEHGDAVSNITADVSGRQNMYNTVFNRFTVRDFEYVEMTGMETVWRISVNQPKPYDSLMTVRYAFLNGSEASYSGMANYYRDYLLEKNQLAAHTEQQADIPFYLDVIGAINKTQYFLGIPYKGAEPITKFKQAVEIVDALKENDIHEINLSYQGWFNKGIKHASPTDIKIDRNLGGKSQFKKLVNQLNDMGIDIYPDVAFKNIYKKGNGFKPARDTARFINRKPVREAEIYYPTGRENWMYDPYYILSPARLPSFVDSFLASYEKLDMDAIYLRDLGDRLNSDHRVARPLNRQQSLVVVQEQLQKISEVASQIMVPEANAYTLPYVTHINDAPLGCSGFIISDECVPFYQMVIHGFIPYSGEPANLANDQDLKLNLLKHIEYGSNVRFTFGYASSSKVKETEFDHLYSIHYMDWLEDAAQMYHQLNEALKPVQSAMMIGHQKHAPGVFETMYSNGISIIVNYNDQPVEVDGVHVNALDYSLKGGNQ